MTLEELEQIHKPKKAKRGSFERYPSSPNFRFSPDFGCIGRPIIVTDDEGNANYMWETFDGQLMEM